MSYKFFNLRKIKGVIKEFSVSNESLKGSNHLNPVIYGAENSNIFLNSKNIGNSFSFLSPFLIL